MIKLARENALKNHLKTAAKKQNDELFSSSSITASTATSKPGGLENSLPLSGEEFEIRTRERPTKHILNSHTEAKAEAESKAERAELWDSDLPGEEDLICTVVQMGYGKGGVNPLDG